MAEEVLGSDTESEDHRVPPVEAMDEGDQRRQTASWSKPDNRGNLGRTGEAGEGSKTRWRTLDPNPATAGQKLRNLVK